MDGKEKFSQIWGCFEIRQNMGQEIVRVCIAGIDVVLGLLCRIALDGCLAIVEDYDFVDTKDSQSTSYLPC